MHSTVLGAENDEKAWEAAFLYLGSSRYKRASIQSSVQETSQLNNCSKLPVMVQAKNKLYAKELVMTS